MAPGHSIKQMTICYRRFDQHWFHSFLNPMSIRFMLILLAVTVMGCSDSNRAQSNSNSKPNQQGAKLIRKRIDVPAIALRPREEADKLLGKPIKFTRRKSNADRGDTADYPWGSILYMDGVVCFVYFKFTTVQNDYRASLAEIGLIDVSAPYVRNADHNIIWALKPFNTEFTCCNGLDFSYVLLSGDLSEAMVWIFKRDEPESWTAEQKNMWTSITGRKLPRQAIENGNVMSMPIQPKFPRRKEVYHSNRP